MVQTIVGNGIGQCLNKRILPEQVFKDLRTIFACQCDILLGIFCHLFCFSHKKRRNPNPEKNRYGCFLPNLTELASFQPRALQDFYSLFQIFCKQKNLGCELKNIRKTMPFNKAQARAFLLLTFCGRTNDFLTPIKLSIFRVFRRYLCR